MVSPEAHANFNTLSRFILQKLEIGVGDKSKIISANIKSLDIGPGTVLNDPARSFLKIFCFFNGILNLTRTIHEIRRCPSGILSLGTMPSSEELSLHSRPQRAWFLSRFGRK